MDERDSCEGGQVNNQFISPGERLDILLDLSDLRVGEELFLESLAFDPMDNESMAPMEDAIGNGAVGNPLLSGEAFNIMKIVIKRRAKAASFTKRSVYHPPIDITDASFRRINLTMNRTQWLINGQSYQLDAFPIHVRQNTVEIWEIVNDPMSMLHPMHLHGFQFQLLERLDSPPQINRLAVDSMGRMVSDLGWRDTIMVWPGESVRIAIDFSHNFSGDQSYVFHCHNLAHEDNGMNGQSHGESGFDLNDVYMNWQQRNMVVALFSDSIRYGGPSPYSDSLQTLYGTEPFSGWGLGVE